MHSTSLLDNVPELMLLGLLVLVGYAIFKRISSA